MLRRAWVYLVPALLLAPLAHAVPGAGTFTTEGPTTVLDGAKTDAGGPLALYADTGSLAGLQIECDNAKIHRFNQRFQPVQLAGLPRILVDVGYSEQTWHAEGLKVSFAEGDPTGFLGVYPDDAASLSLQAEGETTAEPRAESAVGSRLTTSDGATPSDLEYFVHIRQTHLLLTAFGIATYGGGGDWKVNGPDIQLRTALNTTREETGLKEAANGELVWKWVVIEPAGSCTAHVARATFEVAARDAHLAWDGAMRLSPVSGSLRTEHAVYVAGSRDVTLEGAFEATLSPVNKGQKTRLELSGDLRSTSLLQQPARGATGGGSAVAWGVVLLGAVAVGAVGGAAALTVSALRRRRAFPSASPAARAQECRSRAEEHIRQERFSEAFEWYRRARLLSPGSVYLVSQEAFCLARMGRTMEAVALYAEANRMMPDDGDAAVNIARLLRGVKGQESEVEGWLREAIEKSPIIAYELDADFPEVAEKPEWQVLIREATERYEDEWSRWPPR